MTVPNDIIYLLSLSSNASEDGNIYMCNPQTKFNGEEKFDMSMSIKDAKIFYSRQDAWNFREDVDRREWQITPMSAKAVFERKLKAK